LPNSSLRLCLSGLADVPMRKHVMRHCVPATKTLEKNSDAESVSLSASVYNRPCYGGGLVGGRSHGENPEASALFPAGENRRKVRMTRKIVRRNEYVAKNVASRHETFLQCYRYIRRIRFARKRLVGRDD